MQYVDFGVPSKPNLFSGAVKPIFPGLRDRPSLLNVHLVVMSVIISVPRHSPPLVSVEGGGVGCSLPNETPRRKSGGPKEIRSGCMTMSPWLMLHIPSPFILDLLYMIFHCVLGPPRSPRRVPGESPHCHNLVEINGFRPIRSWIRGILYFQFLRLASAQLRDDQRPMGGPYHTSDSPLVSIDALVGPNQGDFHAK
jgi:hypothetical protein